MSSRPSFRHEKVGFPLEGSHARLDCLSCHKSLAFNLVGAACVDCHQDPHKGQLGSSCDFCHTPRTFQAQLEVFKVHDRARMSLFAIHAAVACDSCHGGQNAVDFKTTPTACASCHQKAAELAKTPNHVLAGFTQACETCHSTVSKSWRKTTFKHPGAFPLSGAHAAVACAGCHAERFQGTSKDCVSCHVQAFNTSKNPNHLASGFPPTCAACHRTTSWRPATFSDHGRTRFPLTGAHQKTDCAKCHVGGKYTGTSTECVSCHQANYQATRNPNHVAAGLPNTCATCHGTETWSPAAFDHAKTRFALTGVHGQTACAACHAGGRFKGTSTECFSCHNTDYQKSTKPNHLASGFPTQCTACHSTSGWSPASALDHSKTRFPLTGAHQRTDCTKCHTGGQFSRTPSACYSCHQARYQAAKKPDHVALGFATTCGSCHSTNAWKPASMVDHNKTRFPLTGAHQRVDCARCHVGNKFSGTPVDCVSCHLPSFQATKNPNHVAGNFPSTCASCHTTAAWRPATFADHGKTRFPLTGAHQAVACAQCHVGGKYTGTATDCLSCHQAKYQGTKNPNHVTGGFSTACANCHGTNAWRPATFADHNRTRFPLTGAHQTVACAQCHANGKFTGTAMDCASCHQAKFQATKAPNHVAAGFPTTCAGCHSTVAWRPATFDHGQTKFPLLGAHKTVDCAKCHVGGKYAGTPADCVSCHQKNYQATKNPNHVAGGFPTTCVNCHTTAAWKPASFTDHSKTQFPLTGAHVAVACAQCHVGGKYTGTPKDCVSCHQAKYQATKSPNHVAAGFPTTCAGCHSTTAWVPATFDHGKTKFPLLGAHKTVDCAKCHVGGKFTGTPSDCYSCHQANYQATKNPGHVAGNFPTTCTSCHTTAAWRPASFTDHSKTQFPLTGAHQSVACAQCHVGGKYTGTPKDCVSCHQAKYQATKNPNHVAAGFPTTCAGCHSTTAWSPATFDHGKTKFPLLGAHKTVECAKCHAGGKFTGTPSDCYSCHQANYQATKNPGHVAGNFPTTCAGCHTTAAWRPASFTDHSKTQFPLTGAHQQVPCAQCHVGGKYTGTPKDCVSCHQAKYQATKNPNHVAAGFPTTCAGCHSTAAWTPATFDHGKTKFPLLGAHKTVDCAKCHVGGKFAGTPSDCYSCHQANYQATKNPGHVAGNFPTTCASCHTVVGWKPAAFADHNKTQFPLTGAHQAVACAQCHVGGKYTGTPKDCVSCHQAKFQATKNPNHVAAGFPTTCAGCHNTNAWTPATFDHGRTRFPLTGRHQTATCAQCHVGGKFAGTPTDCVSCHLPNYQATKNPNHVASSFPMTCASCHTTGGWKPATFADHNKTQFPLTGAHQQVPCAQCHVGGKYTGTPKDCLSCHQAKYQATRNPNHVAAGFPTTCAGCHNTNAWTPATFDHGRTRFPLTGRHQTATCAQCHVGGKFAGTPTDCVSCHLPNYQATKNPNHVASSFPMTCASCHTTGGWKPATFADHNKTQFPLTGAHQQVPCAQCHVGGKYTGTPKDCLSCHQAKFQATKNPNHVAAGFPTTCAGCHNTNAWTPATFDHGRTRFPLTGRHQTATCAQCHVGGKYTGTPTDCVSCHLPNYQATKNPNHVASSFPMTCASCHTTGGWKPATFADHNKTQFPLTGAHQQVPCAQCHVGGKYTGTPKDCLSCHQAKYQATRNPNHVAAGFPTTCAGCHNTNGWTPATFDHGKTAFPLTGRHQTVACAQCHVGGKYAGTAKDCLSCHQAKYQATKNPNHLTAGFPTTCASCHTTNGWTPATFDHGKTAFPLTGRHQTVACAQCHVGGKYAGTAKDCFSCHQAKYQATKNPNHVAAGFPTTCASCHTTNGWTPATFDHGKTAFPLTGRHQTVACAQCHVGGKYAGTAKDCLSCHQAKYQATKNPNHLTAGFPTTCASCHTTNGWTPATFDHGKTAFPLTGRHQTVACAQCHVGGKYAGTAKDCFSCHQAKYQATKNPNHVTAGFPTTCATCHTTNGWTPSTFKHTWFKTPHHGVSACNSCHTVPSNYKAFECILCHEHNNKAELDKKHKEEAGYAYVSTACYGCHKK